MDWNRRWAKLKSLPTIFWHKAWFDNAMKIIELVSDKNIKYITLWALSKENLVKRDSEELSWIIKLINELEKLIPKLQKNNIRFETIWDIEKLPIWSQNILKKVKAETSQNTKTFLTVALVYSWQDEIIRAVKKLINSWFDINNLDEKTFRQFIDTSNLPPADLIIRTGWDIRHSGFMLYDSDYSEYYFSKKLWPDFDEKELDNALDFFENCKRNFWK